MAEAIKVSNGNLIDYTPGSAVSAGQVVVQNSLVGVSPLDIPASTLGAIDIEGVEDVTKGATAFAVGDPLYWDDSNNTASPDPSVGPYMGFCVTAAAAGDATVRAKLDAVPNGARDLLYSSVAASTAVSNTTTETDFDKSISIPANTLKAGDIIRVRAQAIATSTNSTDTLNLKLKLGSTVILATGAVDVANNDIGYIDADLVVRTVGASGTMVAAGVTALGTEGTVTAKPGKLASAAVDTTAALVVKVSATWSVASASNSVRLDVMDAQLIRK